MITKFELTICYVSIEHQMSKWLLCFLVQRERERIRSNGSMLREC